ncbi:MAG: cytochrome c oxidase subunit II [Pirellulales bacterium]
MIDEGFRLFPEQASTVAPRVDALYFFLIAVCGSITLLVAVLIVYFAVKYRRDARVDRRRRQAHTYAIETAWIVIPLVLTMIMFAWGASLYFGMSRPPAGAIEIDVLGRQWMWKFQHPEGNREINELHVPRGRPVRLRMISEDVIHSLYVPAFRVKHDVLPDRYTGLWFEATKTGEYHLFCAEYCGAEHSRMRGRVVVLEPADYQAWLGGGTAGLPPVEAGRRLFEQLRCDTCHRGGGLAGRGPPLENVFGSEVRLADGRTVLADEDYLRESILRPQAKVVAGFEPIMPTFEAQVGEEGLMHLIAYLKSLSSQGGTTTP